MSDLSGSWDDGDDKWGGIDAPRGTLRTSTMTKEQFEAIVDGLKPWEPKIWGLSHNDELCRDR